MAKTGIPGSGIARDLLNGSIAVQNPVASGQGQNPLVNSAANAGASSAGFTGFIDALSTRALWIRIAEGMIGVMLIIVGVAELAKGTPVGNVAGKAAKLALIAK